MNTYPCRRRAQRVSQSKACHVFDVDVVVEEDQITTLVFTRHHRRGGASVGAAGGRGGGAARLGGRQGAVGADRNWADVSSCWQTIRGTFGLVLWCQIVHLLKLNNFLSKTVKQSLTEV